ncbi:MAG: isoprenyl transferase [Pseudomonadota bacterium]
MTVALAENDGPHPPRHVAIIMDGNGRWARQRGLPRSAGHKAGVKAVRRCVEAAAKAGVDYVTLFGFSSENWRRSATEVSELMGLLRLYLRHEVKELRDNGVRLVVIGDRTRLPADIVESIEQAEAATRDGGRIQVNIALSYGARDEIVGAAQALAADVAAGRIAPDAIDGAAFAAKLETAGQPDPDLVIRTSGEQRLSNFLLWQAAYAEFVFLNIHWPDFAEADFNAALEAFHGRERRYGAVAV